MGEEILDAGDTTEEAPAAEEKSEPTALTDETTEEKSSDDTDAKASEETDHKDDADQKPEDSKADDGKDGAPSEYTEFTVPEGQKLDADAVAEAAPLLKELGATQEQAQKLVDLQSKMMQSAADAQLKAWTDQKSEWRKASENDEEFGKGKYDASVAGARKALRTFGTPELTATLETSGLGDHPEVIRVFSRIANEIGEDNLSFGQGGRDAVKSYADVIFHKHQNPG